MGGMGLAKAIVFLMAIGLTVVGERRRGKLGAGRRWIEAGLRGAYIQTGWGLVYEPD